MRALLLLLLLWGPERVYGVSNNPEDYVLNVPSQVTVQEGLCVHVPCNFSYPWYYWTESDPVYGFWFLQGSNTKRDSPVATNKPEQRVQKAAVGRFYLVGDPKDNNCTLEIRDARKNDTKSYFFRLERGYTKWNYLKHLLVNVNALTHNPHIDVPETLEAGHPSNLTCSAPWACESGPPPMVSWTVGSVTTLGPSNTRSLVLSLMPRPQDHGTNLTCMVTLPGRNVTRRTTTYLNVSYAPQNLTVTTWKGVGGASTFLENGSFLLIPEGQSLSLLCAADSNPPARLSWFWGNLSVGPLHPSNPGLLEVSPLHLKVGGEFTCKAQNTVGSQQLSLSLAMEDEKQKDSWPLVFTLIRGSVMGTVFLLIYGLTWIYYTRLKSPSTLVQETSACSEHW
uniref:sialic acid-binding Ig-like lectin 7 isoform X1 n=1 Tax=Jaculus jaculus TaxID=51337 RepID=UPI001E1B5F08|nr:sialic acid-binding Ig-like lectin 7 isoform X1 [Jaculus jaculus]